MIEPYAPEIAMGFLAVVFVGAVGYAALGAYIFRTFRKQGSE